MGTKGKSVSDASRLLQEGARSYLDALVALDAFRHEVHKRCRKLVTAKLADLGAAFGGKLVNDAIEDYDSEEQSYSYVGVCIENPYPEQGYIDLFFGLYWSAVDEEDRFGVETTVWADKKRSANRLLKRIKDMGKGLDVHESGGNVSIFKVINPEDAALFEQVMEEQIDHWIRIGKQSGGLLRVLEMPLA